MQCQKCGNLLDQGVTFCGDCGAIISGQQAPLMLPGNQSGHTAPTVVSSGLDIQSAITSDDNPYHSLVTNLKMPSLIRNDDHKRMWQEEKTATRRAWYKNNVFYVKDTGTTNVSVDLAQSVALNDFTLQSLITFHQQQTIAEGAVKFVLAPPSGTPGSMWSIWNGDESNGINTLYLVISSVRVNLRVPKGTPFLIGIIRRVKFKLQDGGFTYEELVFVNLEWVAFCRRHYNSQNNPTGTLGLLPFRTHVALAHTRIWVS